MGHRQELRGEAGTRSDTNAKLTATGHRHAHGGSPLPQAFGWSVNRCIKELCARHRSMSEQNEEEALRFDLSRSAVTYEDDPHVHVRLAPGQDGVQDGVAVRCDIDSCATCSWCAAVLLTVCLMCCQLRCALYIPWVSLIAEPGACLGDASGVLGKEWSVSLLPAMMLLSLSTSYTNMLGEEPPFPSPPLPPPFPPLRPFISLSFCANSEVWLPPPVQLPDLQHSVR